MNGTAKPKIVFASTPDRVFFEELWNSYAVKTAERLGFDVTLIGETADEADRHWPDLLADADAIITTWASPRIDEKILNQNSRLQVIGHAAGSVANYVSDELFERGVAVTSANNAMAHAVAEWCLMGGLIGARKIMNYARVGGFGNFSWEQRHHCGTVKNATVGISGFGAVSRHLVEMLKPLAPERILVCSGHLDDEEASALGVEKVALEELFKVSDIIYPLNGLNDKTRGMINTELLASMKDSSVLVNAGRGPLIDEKALYAELAKNRFVGVLDVFHEEPLPEDNVLRDMPNVILTPHNAGYPSRSSYISIILEEFARYFKGEVLRNEVSPEAVKFMTVKN